ncbi:MAG: hypothetical protein HZB81_03395 [Deltaproteobacteria bacterium]|nr:hypothetical protein [Deltaproteobacteria bacterium]
MLPNIKELNEKLVEASKLLDEAAKLTRDLNLSPETNIRKIAEAMASIFEICHQIYKQHPELAPNELKNLLKKGK